MEEVAGTLMKSTALVNSIDNKLTNAIICLEHQVAARNCQQTDTTTIL